MPKYIPVYFAPDIDTAWSVNPGALSAMDGFAPLQMGAYGSVAAADYLGSALTGTDHLAAYMFRQVNGSVRFLTGRVSNIDEYVTAGTRTNRGTSYNASTVDWSMAAWGNQIIACNFLDATQSSTGAGFAALSGAPKARLVAANVNFVMLADTDDGVTAYPDEVYWSALRNPNSWTVSLATQCGRYRLLDAPGPIRALVAFRQGFVAFKDNAIFVGEFVGPDFIFQWRMISNRIGCLNAKSPIELDGKLFFGHTSGFYTFDGQAIQSIGVPVFQSFLGEAGYIVAGPGSYIPAGVVANDGITKVQTAADDIEGVVWFKTTYTTSDKYQIFLYGYNARTGRWSRTTMPSVLVGGSIAPIFVRCTTADLQAFKADTAGRVLMVWNGQNALEVLRYPVTSAVMSVPSISLGVLGTGADSQTVTRLDVRTLAGSALNTAASVTVSGYTTENKNKTNGTASAVYNSEFDCFDSQIAARYHNASIAWTTVLVLLAGVAVEYAPAIRR